ncbi:MAG: GumC family protein, partial [Cytophaga sp.]|uniref:GumC family protein n=1 Tax=Cytophaga sp. TaxID=29535 RepID=UPI003F7F8D01
MSQINKNIKAHENNLLHIITYKFLPYWPLLIGLIVFFMVGAVVYMRMALPKYEATAVLLVKDEKKGYDESRMIEDLNVFGTKKIVENELEVMQSRTLMKEVVKSLGLYAPVLMKSKIRTLSAYCTSPISVRVKNPDEIIETNEVSFTYDSINRQVAIEGKKYPLGEWIKLPYGELKFEKNTNLKQATTNPLYFSLIPIKKVVGSVLQNLNVKAVNKLSSVVSLQFVDEVPEKAEDILNELINAYNRAGINDKNALADNTMSFVDDRLQHVKSDIDSIEKQIQQFRSEQGAINLSEQSSLFLKNVGENDQQAAVIDMQLSVLDRVQRFVNSGKSIGTVVPSTLGISDPVLSQLLTKLSTTELEYERLKATTGTNNPVLTALSNELSQLRLNIIESIQIQRINLIASRDQLNATNKKYSETLQTIPEKERNLLEISRQKTIINNVYDFLLQKKEETALSYASTVPDSRILDVAESSIKPSSPKKTIVFPVALFLAFVIAFGIVFVKDFISSKILFRSEIENLTGMPAIGELGQIKNNETDTGKINFFKWQLYQIIAGLNLFNKDNTKKKILVTSSQAGEGKTFVCLNLAKELAAAGKKVVLIDLDFNSKTLSQNFQTSNDKGLAEYLKGMCGIEQVITPTEIDNLFIIKCGQLESGYASLFSSNKIHDLLSNLETGFDLILVDTISIDPITDDLILEQFSDITLYVVRHAFTPKVIFQFENTDNRLIKVSNAEIVFNGVKTRGYLKGYGYGYGYDYFHKKSFQNT